MKKGKFICPVCGYDGLEFYPDNSYEICPCCGYEFGTFDYFGEDLCNKFDCKTENPEVYTYIRDKWIINGSKWWSTSNKKPKNWNWKEQLKNIKSKKRIFEENVVVFFVSQIPEINDFVKDSFEYYDITESAGMYIVLPDIVRYLTSCVNKKDYVKAKEFFDVYNEFYETFADEYNQIVNSDTMYNLNAVELFEIIGEFEEDEKKKIIPLMSEKLQKEYREIY